MKVIGTSPRPMILILQKTSGDEDEHDDAPAEPCPPLAHEDPLHPLGQRAQGPHRLYEQSGLPRSAQRVQPPGPRAGGPLRVSGGI